MEKTVIIKVDKSEIDETIEKVRELCELLNRATELADSIAHKDLIIRLSAVSDGKTTELASIATE